VPSIKAMARCSLMASGIITSMSAKRLFDTLVYTEPPPPAESNSLLSWVNK
jgi:hypothetical protein